MNENDVKRNVLAEIACEIENLNEKEPEILDNVFDMCSVLQKETNELIKTAMSVVNADADPDNIEAKVLRLAAKAAGVLMFIESKKPC